MVAILLPLVVLEGINQRDQGARLVLEAGLSTENIEAFQLTNEQRAAYRTYLNKVGLSHSTTTTQYIRGVLDEAVANQYTAQEIKDRLSQYLAEEWRINRLVVTEVNKAGSTGSVDSMINIADETGYSIDKEWRHSGSDTPCPYCQALIGTTTNIKDDFVGLGDTVTGTDGSTLLNDFEPMQTAQAHPACHCFVTYRVIQ